MTRTCPTCRKPAAPRPGNRASPFCSDRCKLLDLGKWFSEDYRVPGPKVGDGEAGADPASEPTEGDPT